MRSAIASRKSRNVYFEMFYGGQKLHNKNFRSLLMKDMSLLTCYELRNGRNFECENKPFIVSILILRKVLF